MKLAVVILLLLLLSSCGKGGGFSNPPLEPCSAILLWAVPKFRINDKPLPLDELAKITIFVNRLSGFRKEFIEFTVDITDVNLIQWEIKDLNRGRHWFYLTVTDTDNIESGFSNEEFKICT